MKYMMAELDELDSLKDRHHHFINDCEAMSVAYQDTIWVLRDKLTFAQQFADMQTDNVNNAESRLFIAEKKLKEERRRQRFRLAAAILAGLGVGLIF